MTIPPHTRSQTTHRQRSERKQSSDVVKLIVTGLHQSGKTRFIQSISQYTEWQAEEGNSWFFGRVRVDASLIMHFLEPPMDRQFDFIWLREVLSRIRATGFVIMLDSTRPQYFGEFLSILYTIRGYHEDAPLVVAANKQDKHNAWSVNDISLGLGIRDVSVLPCVAHEHDFVREIVIDLLYQVMK
jgi:signal recognition particle receptor subunit beta